MPSINIRLSLCDSRETTIPSACICTLSRMIGHVAQLKPISAIEYQAWFVVETLSSLAGRVYTHGMADLISLIIGVRDLD